MQLNLTTDYAIRTLLYLALRDTRTNTTEIAEAMVIPRSYLQNVLGKLRGAGLLSVSHGKDGGYVLAKEPSEITLWNIIQTMEGTTRINRCLEEDAYCSRFATKDCPVRVAYTTLQATFEEQLQAVSLETLRQRLQSR